MARLAWRRWTIALAAVLALGMALPAAAPAAKKKKPPARYSWTMQLETNRYYHSDCTAWGVNRKITENRFKSERESGKGPVGGKSKVEISGTSRELYTVVNTYPDGNSIPEERPPKDDVIPKETHRSSSLRIRKGELVIEPLIGPAFPSVRVKVPKLKKGKSTSVPISETQTEQNDPPDEGCTTQMARTEVKGSVTITRIR